jgi:hypothetical protein
MLAANNSANPAAIAIPREIAQPRQDVDALQEPNGIRQHEEGDEEVQGGFHAPLGLAILPLVLAPRCPATITGLRALGTIGRSGARFAIRIRSAGIAAFRIPAPDARIRV